MSDETPDAASGEDTPTEDTPTEDTPTQDTPTEQVATEPAAGPDPAPAAARPGVFVPRWLAVLIGLVVAVGLVGGAGFWLGRETADDDAARVEESARPFEPREVPSIPDIPDAPQAPQGRVLLGVAVEEADDGAVVVRVTSGSPADDAGIEVGDVITGIDGDEVTSAADLVAAIRSHDPGDEIALTYARDGESTTVDVRLADLSADDRSAS